jgi:hypothetical protein
MNSAQATIIGTRMRGGMFPILVGRIQGFKTTGLRDLRVNAAHREIAIGNQSMGCRSWFHKRDNPAWLPCKIVRPRIMMELWEE